MTQLYEAQGHFDDFRFLACFNNHISIESKGKLKKKTRSNHPFIEHLPVRLYLEIPKYLWLGEGGSDREDLYWNFPGITNR